MIPLKEALDILDRQLESVRLPTETLPVRDAMHRVLQSDQFSRVDLPPFDKSAMDGYAILPDDKREAYRLLETIAAGNIGTKKLEPGTTVKIMTGACVPDGAGQVVMQEDTEEKEGLVKIHRFGAENICRKGEDVKTGDSILAAGTVLGPLEVANLIACGITDVEVNRRPRLAILSTGDEIVDDPRQLAPGKIMNSNGPLLTGLARQFDLEVVFQESVADSPEATLQAFRSALAVADVVVASGGVSVGEFDYVLEAMAEAGVQVRFSRVAVKPGKPTVFAFGEEKCVFGLPGNPVSVFLMFHIFVRRALSFLCGRKPEHPEYRLTLAEPFKRRKTARRENVPCCLTSDGRVRRVEFHGSAHLAALMQTDGIFIVPRGVAELAAGETVTYQPIPKL